MDEEECEAFNSTTVVSIYVWWPPTVHTSEIVKGYSVSWCPLWADAPMTKTAECR